MNLDRQDYKKLVPIAFIIFVGILALIFYFFAQAYNASPGSKNKLGTYLNPIFKVTFNYPGNWNQIGGYDYDRFEGEGGFFGVSGASGEGVSIEEMTRLAYDHPLKPYGIHPVLESLRVDGQPAKLIIPSEDQDPSMHNEAQLIVLYPTPVTIDGDTYHYFILWADKDSIKGIIPTITFRD